MDFGSLLCTQNRLTALSCVKNQRSHNFVLAIDCSALSGTACYLWFIQLQYELDISHGLKLPKVA